MFDRRAMICGASALLLSLSLVGCSDDGTALSIRPFKQTNLVLQVNQPFDLEVRHTARAALPDGSSVVRVGCRFMNPSAEAMRLVEKYVAEKSD